MSTPILPGPCLPQKDATWDLARLSGDRSPPYIFSGGCPTQGRGVHVYVLDSGIRTTNVDFQGRAIPTLDTTAVKYGKWGIQVCDPTDTSCADDKTGHGTHVAGLVGGYLYGVAKESTLNAVKVLKDNGYGENSYWITAIDWIMSNGRRPAIIQMSLGSQGSPSKVASTAINKAVAAGIPVMIAAGNSDLDACAFTPASVPDAFTVGATDENNTRAHFSNFGNCVDLFAPGTNILSAGASSNTASSYKSGTSMATPLATGAAALLLAQDPTLSAKAVYQKLIDTASSNVVADTRDAPNLLLSVS